VGSVDFLISRHKILTRALAARRPLFMTSVAPKLSPFLAVTEIVFRASSSSDPSSKRCSRARADPVIDESIVK
ncbi:hypothetical protein ACC692_37840, partial [Rhizobium ruizarguesonis]